MLRICTLSVSGVSRLFRWGPSSIHVRRRKPDISVTTVQLCHEARTQLERDGNVFLTKTDSGRPQIVTSVSTCLLYHLKKVLKI